MKQLKLITWVWVLSLIHLTMKSQESMQLIVPEIEDSKPVDLDRVSQLLEEQAELHTLEQTPWEAFRYKPKVQFRIAHSNNAIWLKYYVEEENILADNTEPNSSVSRDSCVEFFFDPLGNGKYYNFEFNCIGTIHLAYGPDRHSRTFVDPDQIHEKILIRSSLGDRAFEEKGGGHRWEMTMVLPAEILTSHSDIELRGRSSRANFYKCGDNTAVKHYVTWNPVGTPRPDYHRPEFFGTLIFE